MPVIESGDRSVAEELALICEESTWRMIVSDVDRHRETLGQRRRPSEVIDGWWRGLR